MSRPVLGSMNVNRVVGAVPTRKPADLKTKSANAEIAADTQNQALVSRVATDQRQHAALESVPDAVAGMLYTLGGKTPAESVASLAKFFEQVLNIDVPPEERQTAENLLQATRQCRKELLDNYCVGEGTNEQQEQLLQAAKLVLPEHLAQSAANMLSQPIMHPQDLLDFGEQAQANIVQKHAHGDGLGSSQGAGDALSSGSSSSYNVNNCYTDGFSLTANSSDSWIEVVTALDAYESYTETGQILNAQTNAITGLGTEINSLDGGLTSISDDLTNAPAFPGPPAYAAGTMGALIAEAMTPAATTPYFTTQQVNEQNNLISMLQTTFINNQDLAPLTMSPASVMNPADTTVGTWAKDLVGKIQAAQAQNNAGIAPTFFTGAVSVANVAADFDTAISVVVTKINGDLQTYSPGAAPVGVTPYKDFDITAANAISKAGESAATNLTAITNRQATALQALLTQAQAALTFGHSTLTVITQLSNTVASFQ